MPFAAAKHRVRPRGSQAHRELRAEARAVADAAQAAGPSHVDIGARLRACKLAKHMAEAEVQASSVAALEPPDEKVLRQVWSGAKIGGDAKPYAVDTWPHT